MKEVANSKLRELLAYNKSFDYTDGETGETAPLYKSAKKKSAPRRRGPAKILDVDETGVTMKSQSQTFKEARYCVRKQVEETDVDDDELDPLHVRMRTVGPAPWEEQGQQTMGDATDADVEKGNFTSSAGTPESENGYRPAAVPAPEPPTLSAQLPS